MNEIPIEEIPVDVPLDCYLFHSSGEIIHKPGDTINASHLNLFDECDIRKVYREDASVNPEAVQKKLSHKKIPLDAIPPDEPVPSALFDASGTMVVDKNNLLNPDLKKKLAQTGNTELYYKKDAMERMLFQIESYRMLLESDKFSSFDSLPARPQKKNKAEQKPDAVESSVNELQLQPIPEDRLFQNPAKMISATICKEMMQRPEFLTVLPEGIDYEKQLIKKLGRERDIALDFGKKYAAWIEQADAIFATLKNNRETEFDLIDKLVLEIIENFRNDVYYILNCLNLRRPASSDRYLHTHSINVAILCTGIGFSAGYSSSLLRELVVGAFLHDIGHLLTYRPFLSEANLSSAEQQKYDNHAIVGMAMLKNMSKIPGSTMMVVAQHHEFLDGTGRVYHAPKARIHDFAKIVAVADSFETRCRFVNASTAMLQAIKDAQNGKTDIILMKQMLNMLSLYPIGCSLQLSNNIVCKVIAANGILFRLPVIKSIFTISDDHLYALDKTEIVDLKGQKVAVAGEVTHSALRSDISVGFTDS